MQIKIREASVLDAEMLCRIYAPYVEQTAITFEYKVPSVEEFQRRISHIQQRFPYLVAELDGEIVGYAYADSFRSRPAYDWAVETSIYVKEDDRAKGIGKALYQELERILKKMQITNLYACITYAEIEDDYLTKASIYFHERMGYQMTGMFHQCGYKFNRWYHMVWMEKMLNEHLDQQAAVIWFPQLTKER